MTIVILGGRCGAEAAPASSSRSVVKGLKQSVEILRDHWGIAHIYAQNEADLFFAQGYNAAHDRLFELEVWRMRATGTAAAVLGPEEFKRDVGARLHRFRGDLQRELSFYHPRGESIIRSFVRGVNAYIAETERRPEMLPIEFQLLGIRPGRWTPQVVISRHQGLNYNLTEEVDLARTLASIGETKLRTLVYFQGGDPVLTPDPALDFKAIPEHVLELYDAFREPLIFQAEQILPDYRTDHVAPDQRTLTSDHSTSSNVANSRAMGSNNWVVSGSRTMSSYPILANDPHRLMSVPSSRYWVHLVAPGWDVIGAGESSVPGISIGHNEYGAWGLTIFGNDSEDLYIYEVNPENPNQYRYDDSWEDLRIIRDTIAIKGEEPRQVVYKYTRHGPVLFEDHERSRIYALRAAWLEIGNAPYLASLRMMQAHSWEEFREACSYNLGPAENMVWADRDGNIGYQATGIRPLRRNWSGLLPVPGRGSHEWDGYLAFDVLPNAYNPTKGFIATANQYLMPIDYPFPEAMHYLWADPYRAGRISEVLGSGRLFDVSEMAQLQNDVLSIPARSLVPLLRDIRLSQPLSERARFLLLDWNFVLDKDSVAAGIYAKWQQRLEANFRRHLLQGHTMRASIWLPSVKRLVDWLYAPGGELDGDPIVARDELLARSFEEAVAELSDRFGTDMDDWRYGQYHHVVMQHPLSFAVNDEVRNRLDIGSAPRGGGFNTVNLSLAYKGQQLGGGSFKIIIDTENWDNSIGQNVPGQSGNPDSPHYSDLFEMWAQGKYFPVAYSRTNVESVTKERLLLLPALSRGEAGALGPD